MPGPSTIRQLLSIPFARGLSQHEAPEYLAPGGSVTARNAIHPKINRLAKRQGFVPQPTLGIFPATGQGASVSVSMSTGRRLGNWNNKLFAIARDLTWADAVWIFDDNGPLPVLLDRAPEVYCEPPDLLSGVASAATLGSPLVRATQMDQAIIGDYEVTVSTTFIPTNSTYTISYMVRDASTFEVLEASQTLMVQAPDTGTPDIPKLVVTGNFVTLCFVTSAFNIYAMTKDMSAPGNPWLAPVRINNVLNEVSMIVGSNDTAVYDVTTSIGETTKFALAYTANNGGTKTIVLSRIDTTGGVISIASTAGGVDSTWVSDGKPPVISIALRADAGANELALVMSYTAVATPRVTIGLYSWPALANTATQLNLAGTPGPLVATSFTACAVERIGLVAGKVSYKVMFSAFLGSWENGSIINPCVASYIAFNNSGAMAHATNNPRVTWGLHLWSRILPLNGIAYVVCQVPSAEQGSFFLMADDAWADITCTNNSGSNSPMRIVANLSVRQSSIINSTILGQVALTSRVQTHIPLNPFYGQYQAVIPRDTGPTSCAPSMTRLDFSSSKSYQCAQLGETTLLSGGCPSQFDGSQVFEVGFPVFPVVNATAGGGGSGTIPSGTYSYICLYKWEDARGQVHLSPRSVAVNVICAANDSVTLNVSTLGYSNRCKAQNAPFLAGSGSVTVGPQANLPRRRPIEVAVYRTTLTSPTTYYQLFAGFQQVLQNPTVNIADSGAISDAVLATHPLLYGDGTNGAPGILDRNCPPACQGVVVHQNRAFFLDGPNVWPTQVFTAYEGLGVNENIAFSVDDGPGALTAGASMDGHLVLYKADRLFFMDGIGPNDSGGANDWQPPLRIASDCGCVDWRSVVTTPQGTYFLSRQGERVLTRDLQVTPLPIIENELALYPTPTSAVMHQTQNRMLLTLMGVEFAGEMVGHDYLVDSWTTSIVTGAGAPRAFVSAVVANQSVGTSEVSTYYALQPSGVVLAESATSNLDGSTYVPLTYESAWVHAEGIEGFARFRRLMVTWQNADPHQLLVYVAYDMAPFGDAPTYYLIGTVTATMMAAMTTPMCEVAFPLPRQRAQAVRFKLVDAADGTVPAVTGAGPVLISLGLEVAIYQQKRFGRVSAAQRS